jgi:prepilin-type N-terminal cleavage/methylation domain-containing protein
MLRTSHTHRAGLTLIEIMIVVAIIAIVAAIGVPNILRARKRSQATRILADLRIVDSAMDMYAIETNKGKDAGVEWADLQPYLKTNTVIYSSGGRDVLGNPFEGYTVDATPKLSATSFGKLSDAVPAEFWSPFYP